jgi:CIC family chloride channel protein
VIVANTIAYVISRGLQPIAIFDVLSRQDGLELPSTEEQREEDILRVEDAMRPAEGPVLDAQETVDQALRAVEPSPAEEFLVRLSPSGWNSATKQQLRAMAAEGKGGASLESLLPTRQIRPLHPDLPLETALRYVDRWPLVPVVSRADSRRLEGVITQRDVLARYREFGEG